MTTFTDEIRETVSPHKFGGDRMAAALWLLSMDSGYDDATGDACDWHCWVALYGRRIQYVDPQGFVSQERFPTVQAAREHFDAIDASYAESLEEDTSDLDYPALDAAEMFGL